MERGEGPLARSIFGFLGYIILGGLVIAVGANAAIIFGGICLMSGVVLLSRRRPVAGLSTLAFGALMIAIGLVMKGRLN